MRKAVLVSILSLNAMFFSAMSPSDPEKPKDGEPEPSEFGIKVVVTASKTSERENRITQQVQVVESAEMDRLPVGNRNLSEYLKWGPGLFVNVLSRNDANWGSYGGLGPKYNSFLLDGLPADAFIDTMSLDPWVLDRIESHRGPSSVLYPGTMTMDFAGNQSPLAGVTNMVLKERIEERETRFMLDGGSWRSLAGKFYHQDRKGGFNYFVGGGVDSSDYTNYGAPGSWLNMLDSPDYFKARVYARGTYLFDEPGHALSLFAHGTAHDGDTGRPNRGYRNRYGTFQAEYRRPLTPGLDVGAKVGFRDYDRTWEEDSFPASLALASNNGSKQRLLPADLSFRWRQGGGGTLTFGWDTQRVGYRTFAETRGLMRAGNDATAWNTGLYAEEKQIVGKWVLRAGCRFNATRQSYSLIGGETPGVDHKGWNRFLGGAGVRYNASESVSLYTNIGTSFVPPSVKSVGGTLQMGDLGVPGKNGQLPNPDLKPESGLGYDIGVKWLPRPSVRAGIRVFVNRVRDMIVENVVCGNPSQTRSVNAGQALSYGVEIPLEHLVSARVRWFANATLTRTRLANPLDPDQDGADLSFVPVYQFNAGAALSLPWGVTAVPVFQATGEYYDSTSKSGRRAFGPYQTLSLRVEKAFSTKRGGLPVLFLDVNNLADNRYEMPWQFRDPGFQILAGLDWRF